MICPESGKQHFKSELIDLVQTVNAKLLENDKQVGVLKSDWTQPDLFGWALVI